MTSKIDFLCDDLTIEFPFLDGHSRSFPARFRGEHSVESSIIGLDRINIKIKSGDRIGLIGRNGAGKSTLLRTLAGVYEPTKGHIEINTKTTNFFGVGVGVDQSANGYENIPLLMALREIPLDRLGEVVADVEEFTELGDALFRPLRTYSAGMRLRIAFAVATFDVQGALLMDEVIGVGDRMFRKKAKARLEAIIDKAPTLLLASHSMGFLKSFCDKAIVFDGGQIEYQGSIKNAEEFYTKSS